METHKICNRFGNIISSLKVVVEPRSVQDLIAIMQNSAAYPSPVQAVGSDHSTIPCGVADNGTLVVMRHMSRILNIGSDSITSEAGALYISVARELQKHGLPCHVNTEIGSLSRGSGACCGTKAASMPGEFGQVCTQAIASSTSVSERLSRSLLALKLSDRPPARQEHHKGSIDLDHRGRQLA
jgi:hypothetical protein